MSDRLQWFRLWSDAVDDEKLRLLAFEDRWHFVALLCCKAQGFLDDGGRTGSAAGAMMRRKVAVKLGLQVRELEEVGRRLAEVGLIDEETLEPAAWFKRQRPSDRSTERVKAWRENQRAKCNGSETLQQRFETAPETETETETEKNYSPNGESPKVALAPSEPEAKANGCPYDKIRTLWVEILPHLRKPIAVEHWTDARKATIRARWRNELPDLEAWEATFRKIAKSRFLSGQSQPQNGRKPFEADLFWISKPENLLKLYEGKYADV